MSAPGPCPATPELSLLYQKQLPHDRCHTLVAHVRACKTCFQQLQRIEVQHRRDGAPAASAYRASPPKSNSSSGSLSDLINLVRNSTTSGSFTTASQSGQSGFSSKPGTEGLGMIAHYRLLQQLGEGGMGVVYKAQDMQLGRRVALKVIKADVAAHAQARQRFVLEARAMAALRHDNIITIYEVGEADEVLYMAMEYLRGDTLERVFPSGAPVLLGQVLRISTEVATGLAAAHKMGLIHRDIKPANIWIESPSCRVKILDFGLAMAMNLDAKLTGTGQIVGTPECMAPEQARGLPVDERCDLFSLGYVMYRLLTGRSAFQGDDVLSRLTSLAVDRPPSVRELNPNVPESLSDLVTRLLAKDPSERPASADAVLKELAALNRSVTTFPARPMAPPAPPAPVTPAPATPAAPAATSRPARFPTHRVSVEAGDFVIEGPADTLAVIATAGGVVLHDLTGDRKYQVIASSRDAGGETKLQIKDLGSAMVFETATFSLQRGEQTFRVLFERRC